MAYSNSRIKATFVGGSQFTYSVYVSGSQVFTGRYNQVSVPGTSIVDITEILIPYVHAEELTNLASGSGPTNISYSVGAYSATVTSGSIGTVSYLNDFALTSIPSPVRPQDWGLDKVAGQYYFSYSAQGSWTGSQYGSTPDTCQYNAEIIFTDPFGMPQGIPVKALLGTQCDWTGYARVQDYQSKRHRTTHLHCEKQLSWTCYTPALPRQHRERITRWLGQSEYVYLYDIDSGELHPCVTPSVDSGSGIYGKLTIALTTDY